MCVGEIFRRFSTTEAISSKTSDLKHSRMANTMACQDEVQSRSELSDEHVPNEEQGRACKNAPEKGAAAALKRAFPAWIQPSRIINGESQDFYFAAKGGWSAHTSRLNSTIPDHQWRVPGFLFCSEGWVNYYDSVPKKETCRQSHLTKDTTSHPYLCTWQALQTPIPPFDTRSKAWHRIFEQWNVKNRSKSCTDDFIKSNLFQSYKI
jgi:hypothetical protein